MNKRLRTRASILTGVLAGLGCTAAMADAGDLLVRLRALHVSPNDDSSAIGDIPGSSVSVDPDTTIELDLSYFFTRHLAVEAIFGTSRHDINGKGSVAGLGKLAKIRTLPPTVTLQYHFLPEGRIRPYAGLGVNYTLFYDEQASNSLESALGPTNVDLSSSWGLAAQAGVDIALKNEWFVNLDAKYIRMDTTATLNSGGVVRKANVDIDPWFIGIGVGRRF